MPAKIKQKNKSLLKAKRHQYTYPLNLNCSIKVGVKGFQRPNLLPSAF